MPAYGRFSDSASLFHSGIVQSPMSAFFMGTDRLWNLKNGFINNKNHCRLLQPNLSNPEGAVQSMTTEVFQ